MPCIKDERWNQFYLYLTKDKRLKQTTAQNRVQNIQHILSLVKNFNRANFDTFLAHQSLDENRQKNYLNLLITAAKHWANFTGVSGFDTIAYFDTERGIKHTLSDSQIEELLAIPRPKNCPQIIHDFYNDFFACLAFTGMRPNELAIITKDNVDLGNMIFEVTRENSKTGTARKIPIILPIQEIVNRRYKESMYYLFVNPHTGKTLKKYNWITEFNKRTERMGIRRPGLTTYSLRHSYCTELCQKGADIFAIQAIMGHSDPKTTAGYYHENIDALHSTASQHRLVQKFRKPEDKLEWWINKIKPILDEGDLVCDFSRDKNVFKLTAKIKW